MLAGAMVDAQTATVCDRFELLERDVESVAHWIRARLDQNRAARDLIRAYGRHAQRDALSRVRVFDRRLVDLHGADSHGQVLWFRE